MRLRELKLVLLIMVLIATHNECRLRVTAIEAEPTPRTEYYNK